MAKATGTRPRKANDPTRLGRELKKRLRSGDVLLGAMVMEYLRPSLVKLYRHAGFDFIFIENEHAFLLGSEQSDFVLTALDNDIPVIAKTSQLERGEVGRLLDAGVVGIQLPRTESRDDLMALIEIVKFPPIGSRAGAPCYGNVDYVLPDDDRAWLKKANGSTCIVAHIETVAGYENAEEIITTPHIDMVYVGPYDFSISMGHPGKYDHPKVKKAMWEILALCRKHKVAFGTTASGPATARQWINKGCQFFEVVDELQLIRQGATETVSAYQRMMK